MTPALYILLPLLIAAFLALIAGTALGKKLLRLEGKAASTHLILLLFAATFVSIYWAAKSCFADNNPVNALLLLVVSSAFLALLLLCQVDEIVFNGHSPGDAGALILLAAAATILALTTTSLLVIFLALGLVTLACLVISGLETDSSDLLMLSVPTFVYLALIFAIAVLGAVLLYGTANSLEIIDIINYFSARDAVVEQLAWIGFFIILLGFLSFLPLAPFHLFWPNFIASNKRVGTATFVSGATIAVVGILLKFAPILSARPVLVNIWQLLAIITIFYGAIVALRERTLSGLLPNIMLYISGELVILILAAIKRGALDTGLITLNLSTYLLIIISFLAICRVLGDEHNESGVGHYNTLSGLWQRQPFLAFMLIFLLLSVGGMPLTAGFTLLLSLWRQVIPLSLGLGYALLIANIMVLVVVIRLVYIICFGTANEENVPKFSKSLFFLLTISLGLLGLLGIAPDIPLLLLGSR